MVDQFVFPACLEYKGNLADSISKHKIAGLSTRVEMEIYKKLEVLVEGLNDSMNSFEQALQASSRLEHHDLEFSKVVASDLLPLLPRGIKRLKGEHG